MSAFGGIYEVCEWIQVLGLDSQMPVSFPPTLCLTARTDLGMLKSMHLQGNGKEARLAGVLKRRGRGGCEGERERGKTRALSYARVGRIRQYAGFTFARAHTHSHTRKKTRTYAYANTCTHIHATMSQQRVAGEGGGCYRMYIYACIRVFMYICVYTYAYIYMYIYVYTYKRSFVQEDLLSHEYSPSRPSVS